MLSRRVSARYNRGRVARRPVEPVLRMSGLINWLRPDTIVQSAGAVTSWGDASGQTDAYTQGTGANQPTYISSYLAGRAGVHFDSTAKNLVAVNNAKYNVGQGSFLYLMVGEWTGASAFASFWAKCNAGTANHLRLFRTGGDGLPTFWGTDAQNYATSALTWPTVTPRVMGWGVDASALQSIYISNGTIERSTIVLNGTGGNAEGPRLNGDTSGAYTATYKQAESAFYTRGASAFSNAEIASVVSGLRSKYGI